MFARIRALAEQMLERWSSGLEARGVTARRFLPAGVPTIEILKIARRERPDVMLVGKQSRSRVPGRYLDATIEGVLKGAECPILVTKYPKVAEGGPGECERLCGQMFRRVVYATDWSDAAAEALQLVDRSGWRNAIWGSTTERIVRHTAQAVLVIKGESPGEQ